ncbi:winged helix-turn-helix transcriptional regulator [Streptomyces sp. NRRL S-1868]|uniref:winged helix-turn-helix transcriptional regulator n=1 Tax=Streptomyces sp. NRRL S-1868 TaxID=1463892 RepID=UPI0004C8DDEF|nr:helix-turn-helix domain-containing protein [Streptomyces sp. NRRL S-1868]
MPSRPRRSYDQFCAIARALDSVGDRWSLLIVRELLAGPRRYTDLHADLPGVSTDVLAARLKHLEGEGLVVRRALPRPATAKVYELTARGGELLPVLTALARWGAADLGTPRSTDAVRVHWWAVPVRTALEDALEQALGPEAERRALVEVHLPEGVFHVRLGDDPPYGEGPAPHPADATLKFTPEATAPLTTATLTHQLTTGTAHITGNTPLAQALRPTPPPN